MNELLGLSKRLAYEVAKHLEVKELAELCLVSSKLNSICQDESFWWFKFRSEANDLVINAKPDSFTILAWFKFLTEHKLLDADLNMLLNMGVKLNVSNLVKYAIENGADIHNNKDFALRTASERGQYDILVYLVEHGANIHTLNDYPLRVSAKHNNYASVIYLVEHGANIRFGE